MGRGTQNRDRTRKSSVVAASGPPAVVSSQFAEEERIVIGFGLKVGGDR